MKKNNKKTFSLLTVLLAVLAVCLLVVGGIGVTRAVLIESEEQVLLELDRLLDAAYRE